MKMRNKEPEIKLEKKGSAKSTFYLHEELPEELKKILSLTSSLSNQREGCHFHLLAKE